MQGYACAGIVAAIVAGGPVTTAVVQSGKVAVHSVVTEKPDDTAVGAGQTGSPRPQPVLDVAAPRPAVTPTIYLPRSGRPEPLPRSQPPLPVLRPTPVEDHQQPAFASKPVGAIPKVPAAPSVQPAEVQPAPTRRPARVRRHRHRVTPPRPPRHFRAAPRFQMPAAPSLQQALPAPVQQYPQPVAGLLPVQAVPQVQMPAPIPVVLPLPTIAPAPTPTPTPQPGQTPAISMLTTSEIGMGDHASWVPVLGIAIAAEVALLWVAACLGIWRRRMAFAGGYSLPHPARTLTKMCGELRKARLPFQRRS